MDTELKKGYTKAAAEVKNPFARLLIYGQTIAIVLLFWLLINKGSANEKKSDEQLKQISSQLLQSQNDNKDLQKEINDLNYKHGVAMDSVQHLLFNEVSKTVDILKQAYGNEKNKLKILWLLFPFVLIWPVRSSHGQSSKPSLVKSDPLNKNSPIVKAIETKVNEKNDLLEKLIDKKRADSLTIVTQRKTIQKQLSNRKTRTITKHEIDTFYYQIPCPEISRIPEKKLIPFIIKDTVLIKRPSFFMKVKKFFAAKPKQ